MACSIIRNKETNAIEKVLAPNGQESKLYQDILAIQPDPEQALKTWAQVYTPSFKESFGNWEKLETAKVNDPSIDTVTLENLSKDVSKNVDENGEPLISALGLQNTTPNTEYLQQSPDTEETPKEDLDNKVKNFLASMGVSVESVDTIRDRQGNPLSAIAKADMLGKIIQVVEAKADVTTLPEEAAHFFVELLGENHPLFQQMLTQITSYDLYKDVVAEYKNNSMYRNADGTVNFTKLKKEAMGKLIAQYIINNETGTDTVEKIGKVKSWFEKLMAFISKLFMQAPKQDGVIENPFQTSAAKIVNNDTTGLSADNLGSDEYLQISNSYDKLQNDQNRIQLDDSIDPATGVKKHIYTIDGKPIVNKDGSSRSVSSVKVTPWYKKMFPTDNRDELTKKLNDLQAEWGTDIHEDIQNIVERHIDKNGLLRSTPLPATKKLNNPAVYKTLEDYVSTLLKSYEPGTKFMAEVKIYDPKANIPGSIDLVAFLPDGSVDIYDWKSQIIGKTQTDAKWFKEPAYRIQLSEYQRILTDQYGITKFNKVRAIPIATDIKYVKTAGQYVPMGIQSVELGDIDPKKIPENKSYLIPIVAQYESTGDESLDALIVKLNAIYDKVLNTSVKDEEITRKRFELNKIKKAIRDLQVKQNISTFIENGVLETEKYQEKLAANTITLSDIIDSENILKVYAEADEFLEDQLRELKKQINAEQDPDKKQALKDLQVEFSTMYGNAGSVVRKLEKKRKELGEQVAQKNGFTGLLKAEKSLDWMKRTFRSLSTLTTTALKVFYKELSRAQGTRDLNIDTLNDELTSLKTSVSDWASTKGLSSDNVFDSILNFDEKGNWTGEFLKKYDPEYYKKREAAIKSGDAQWIKDNTDFDQEGYNKGLQREEEYINAITFSTDAAKDKELKEQALQRWIENHSENSKAAYFNLKNYYLKPKDTWFSEKYKELIKPENKAMFEAYEYFQKLIRQSSKNGMLDKFSAGFIPNVQNDKLEMLVYEGLSNMFNTKGLFENLQTNSQEGFGEIDPLDGKLKRKIPVYFTNDLGVKKEDGSVDYSNKSKDLFRVFSIWGSHMYNYEAMDSIKDVSETLVAIERNKQSLNTNLFGKVKDLNDLKNGNDINAETLESFVRYYVYGQTLGGDVDKAIKIGNKEYSAVKAGRAVVSFLSIKTLALNVLSGTATFVGGTGNAFFQASKRTYFNEKDWALGFKDFTSRDQVTLGSLDFFNIGLEDMKRESSNQLSINAITKHVTMDKLFFIQRNGDKAVQYPILATLLRTHMIENGEIVDINKFVKDKYNYENFYNLSRTEQKIVRAQMEKEIAELKETRSLKVIGKIENDKLVFPGLDRNSETVLNFRNKVKKINKSIIGNSTHDDINHIRMGLFGQVLMQFRSWMPQMVTERFGDLAYDTDLDTYNYGKARVFFKHLVDKNALPLIKEMLFGFGTDTFERAKGRYAEMVIRMREQGEEFNMTESEFVDMYVGNLRSMMREMMVLLAFFAMVMWAKGADDDDEETSGTRKFIAKAMEKYQNEFAFYYSPTEFQAMLKNPVPMMSLLRDTESMFKHTLGQVYGFGLGDEDIMDDYKPAKYFGKLVPIFKEGINTYALFDDDFRKEWDIRK